MRSTVIWSPAPASALMWQPASCTPPMACKMSMLGDCVQIPKTTSPLSSGRRRNAPVRAGLGCAWSMTDRLLSFDLKVRLSRFPSPAVDRQDVLWTRRERDDQIHLGAQPDVAVRRGYRRF